jgi:hypothetical protein
MRPEHSQACPLCGAPAHYILVDYSNRKYFHCPNCTYFQISRRAEQLVLGTSKDVREGMSALAKSAEEGFALLIRMPSMTPPSGLRADIETVYVARSELPD